MSQCWLSLKLALNELGSGVLVGSGPLVGRAFPENEIWGKKQKESLEE
jgi:hypothetical protein